MQSKDGWAHGVQADGEINGSGGILIIG